MKLRNKKTGEVGELHYEPDKEYHFTVATEDPADMAIYQTLAALNEEWEDYKPAEPLIKDEKIRKAVRAWADAWNKNKLYKDADNALSTVDNFVIQFGQTAFIDLEEKKPYTIAELCGEEEE